MHVKDVEDFWKTGGARRQRASRAPRGDLTLSYSQWAAAVGFNQEKDRIKFEFGTILTVERR